MSRPYNNCTEISPACPIEGTLYGYYPNKPANGAYAIIFVVCLVAQLILGIRYKTKSYAIALSLGCLIEVAGYVGRILLSKNPWSRTALSVQLVSLIIAPAFLAAGIYLTLKHIIIAIEPRLSRIPAKYYTWIFISCDIASILIQGAGGAVASKATSGDTSATGTANDILMTGISFQVVTLVIFGVLASIYATSVYRNGASLQPHAVELIGSRKFRVFVSAMAASYLFILTRCVYRIGEMAGGWKNPISRNETDFMVLDGLMCFLAALCMTVAHPGIWFPKMQQDNFEPIRPMTSDTTKNSGADVGLVTYRN